MSLTNLKAHPKRNTSKRRRGRGDSSGRGNFSKRGVKGQSSRSGGRRRPGFEGGQMPLIRRMPKLGGFKCPNRVEHQVVNVKDLEVFNDKDTVNADSLYEKNLINKKHQPVKILGEGEITKALTVEVEKVSKTAIEKIEKAKGKVNLPESKKAQKSEKKEKTDKEN